MVNTSWGSLPPASDVLLWVVTFPLRQCPEHYADNPICFVQLSSRLRTHKQVCRSGEWSSCPRSLGGSLILRLSICFRPQLSQEDQGMADPHRLCIPRHFSSLHLAMPWEYYGSKAESTTGGCFRSLNYLLPNFDSMLSSHIGTLMHLIANMVILDNVYTRTSVLRNISEAGVQITPGLLV